MTVTGETGVIVGSNVTLNIGKAGVATTFVGMDAAHMPNVNYSMFKVDGGTLNIVNTTFSECEVGDGTYSGIITASNIATVTVDGSYFTENTTSSRQLFYATNSTMTITNSKFGIDADGEAAYNIFTYNGEVAETPSTYASLFVVDGATTLTLGSTEVNANEIATDGYRLVVSTGNSTSVSIYSEVDSNLVVEQSEPANQD